MPLSKTTTFRAAGCDTHSLSFRYVGNHIERIQIIGAIAGDIIGSVYEWERIKTKQFDLFSPDCVFTDDTVLTVALVESILTESDLRFIDEGLLSALPRCRLRGVISPVDTSSQKPALP